MSYLTKKQISKMCFKRIGKNVKISNKASVYNANEISLGDNTRIDDFVVVSGNVSFGRNVHLAVFCNIAGGTAGISFSDFSSCAYGCHIFSQTDDYSGIGMTNPTVPKKYLNTKKGQIYIGKHVIIGTSSIVLPGVRIEDGCSIGAMSLVTKSTLPYSIYLGTPARRIKSRKKNFLELEKLYLRRA